MKFIDFPIYFDVIYSEFRETFCSFQFQRFHFHINIFKRDPQAKYFRIHQNLQSFAEICKNS